MGRCYDPAGVVGHGCRPGMVRLRAWARANFGGGDLGCFNPNSRAGSGPSLHADGRADDIAFNAHDDLERAAGDRFFHWIIAHHAELGLQETLWRGYLWSCPKADLGIRGPGIQQGPHENHVHWGVTYEAANYWDESWLTGSPTTPVPAPTVEEDPDVYLQEIVADDKPYKNLPSFPGGVMLMDGVGRHGCRFFESGQELFDFVASSPAQLKKAQRRNRRSFALHYGFDVADADPRARI